MSWYLYLLRPGSAERNMHTSCADFRRHRRLPLVFQVLGSPQQHITLHTHALVRTGNTMSEHDQPLCIFFDIRSSSVGISAVVSSTPEYILNLFGSSQPLPISVYTFRKLGEERHRRSVQRFWIISPRRGKSWRRQVTKSWWYLYASKPSIQHSLPIFGPHVARHLVF